MIRIIWNMAQLVGTSLFIGKCVEFMVDAGKAWRIYEREGVDACCAFIKQRRRA